MILSLYKESKTTLFFKLHHIYLSPSLFTPNMEKDTEDTRTFDMDALRTNLPHKRGLSRHYSGKSRTFTCMADVHCLEDLKKQEHPDAKKRKKYSDRKKGVHISPYTCRRVSSSTQCTTPYVGV
ncbi:protein OXIDATIVE STRESS 3 LIKE 3-like [Alnus glutinosa]|uniref:protein OXIDATIVE STRESS 3 LIKE 3-like n=1 Tax=Alnus glutinosa TaxID=3517 RepID=UPI002D78B642|nr:protein OXIDATIVE STRESS 3 LIKE 3-like [Alnus glutinosa]